MTTTKAVRPKVGEVWVDCDKRVRGRNVTILHVDATHAHVRSNRGVRSRIALAKFRDGPTAQGFVRAETQA